MNPSQAAERTPIILGTATPGGGFELYGGVLAEVVNSTDASLNVLARNTRGSRQNIPLLEQGTLDVALVASLPAREAFEGIGAMRRPRSRSSLQYTPPSAPSPSWGTARRRRSPIWSARRSPGAPSLRA
jgi:TRAP-type uncharacterized transport system substrate-binding protein